ncbi:MAG: NADH-ubiquinone oxidoreductase-F iron-sulfur binding region domain-containing protein [Planctomycetota bacterium]|nr:NADH-ubiquinone oxidoreductase-F iron-sulfur binding region domain-containing protein [Planctomycetota bacterium]
MNIDCLSSLRGCGGAGFSTAFKWQAVRDAESIHGKFIICNADEGEPGTFKDGWLFDNHCGQVISGMLRAADFVGASRGFIYLRPEYSEQLYTIKEHISELITNQGLSPQSGRVFQASGFPGRPPQLSNGGLDLVELSSLDWFVDHGSHDLVGELQPSGGLSHSQNAEHPLPQNDYEGDQFCLDICIGGGAYICGEETALIESIEGRRPQPRHKPPFPTTNGLWASPTLVNNVETFWWAERLLSGEWQGEPERLFSVSGDVNSPGVYQAPLTVTARQLINDFAGGTINDRPVECWIPGGAATGVLPESVLDCAMNSDSLKQQGTALGTGAIVVFCQQSALQVSTKIMQFFAQESCSQCTPCRIGCAEFANYLNDAQHHWPHNGDIEDWLQAMEQGSICGLGFTAPLVVRQLERHFNFEGLHAS